MRKSSLLFAGDVVPLLLLSNSDLQLTLGQFAAECEAAGTSKSKAMILTLGRGVSGPCC